MKKLFITFMAAVLLVPLFGLSTTTQAHAATKVSSPIQTVPTDPSQVSDNMLNVNGVGNQYSEKQTLKILDSAKLMDKYIVYKDGVLSLSEKAASKVDPYIYNYYKTGIDNINNAVSSGYIKLDQKNKQVISTQSTSNSQGMFHANYTVNKYWWGIRWYLSKSESNKYANMFQDDSFGWGIIVTIFGWLGGPISGSISMVIMSVGDYYLYTQLRDHTSSRGSVLVFKWTPPSAYAYKR
ncbi:hypothetical protein [Sporolactobacillus laevolacticus]|uniref:Uncharacterized protein n=1 Tax=Sporolactobacillus laevolacticus DSM 442 TaxID=1395513 RepID=V6ITU0_9BACL|nr:hypothetical protein [Sporolactobacillus laevolacticus]EST10242.1 hypothetical protein P343_18265 [Sporolactobacillus laevolacticus DSM 442]